MRPARISRKIKIGSSQYFLLKRRNSHSSTKKLVLARLVANLSKSLSLLFDISHSLELAKIAAQVGRRRVRFPVGARSGQLGVPAQRIAAQEPEHQPDRREH